MLLNKKLQFFNIKILGLLLPNKSSNISFENFINRKNLLNNNNNSILLINRFICLM